MNRGHAMCLGSPGTDTADAAIFNLHGSYELPAPGLAAH